MTILNDIASVFSNNFSKNSVIEDFDVALMECETKTIDIKDINFFNSIIYKKIGLDHISIYCTIGEGESDSYSSLNDNFEEFTKAVLAKSRFKADEEYYYFKILINKIKVENSTSIYSIKEFSNYLNKFNLLDLLNLFSKKISGFENIIFKCFELSDDEEYSTKSIHFINFNKNYVIPNSSEDRLDRIKNVYSTSYSYSTVQPNVVPEEMLFISSNVPVALTAIFEKCAFALLVISLFDYSEIRDNEISYKLIGYKTLVGNFNSIAGNNVLSELYSIYSWIFSSGSIVDKIGLARNILSLHLDDAKKFTIKGSPYQSILSSYKLYEKQNIKQYIEIRNKISDQLIDFNKRATQLVDAFGAGYQKSALALITFFSTLVGIKFLSASKLSFEFSANAYLISISFILISVLYLFYTRLEINDQKERFVNSYKNLKDRYTDLLNTEDIQKILNEDKEHNEDVIFISKKISTYTKLWVITVVGIFIVSTFLFSSGIFEIVKNIVDFMIGMIIQSIIR